MGAAAADEDEGIFCFEFSIPLVPESGSPYHLEISDQRPVKMGFEIAGMSEEEKENLKTKMEERQGSMQGGGRDMGGMSGGGRRRGAGGKRPQMPDMDGEDYWISVKLATQ